MATGSHTQKGKDQFVACLMPMKDSFPENSEWALPSHWALQRLQLVHTNHALCKLLRIFSYLYCLASVLGAQ